MSTRTTLLRLAVALSALFNALLTIRLLRRTASQNTSYSYIDDDFPPVLDVPGIDSALELIIQPTVHYQLNGSLADQEWGMLLPEPAVLVRLGPHYRPFAISMLHSLHCLDKLRHSIQEVPRTQIGRIHVEHCANYIRESILCAADTTLEPASKGEIETDDSQAVTRKCRDWTAVYEEIRRNHDQFVKAAVAVLYH
ncbi:hypothetical protein ACEPAF_1548 [Sanghuangporus sanghuang]